MSDRLNPGQELKVNQRITSRNGIYYLILQNDGNVVLYRPSGGEGVKGAVWDLGTTGKGGDKLVMQTDGNLVLYAPGTRPVWASNTAGIKGVFLVVQDDGNLVAYQGRRPVWTSNTQGGHKNEEKGWLENAVSSAGKAVGDVTSAVGSGIKGVTDLAGKVPLVGPGLHGLMVVSTGPFSLAERIAKGERVDKAVLGDLKEKVSAYKEIAPYAQTVVSVVPGIGQGAAAAIGASSALVQGQPIDKALIAGVKGALPGGAIAAAAFDVVGAAVSGENILKATGNAAIDVLKLPPAAKNALNIVYKAAKGDNIPMAALDEAINAMPTPEAKKAAQIAIAVAHGQKLQNIAARELGNASAGQLNKLASVGSKVIGQVSQFQGVQQTLDRVQQKGFQLGTGLMAHQGVTEKVISGVRAKLMPEEKKGFDLAVSSYIGSVNAAPPPQEIARNPVAAGAYLASYGMQGAGANDKVAMMKTIANDPRGREGATKAIDNIMQARNGGIWHKIKRFFVGD